MLRHSRSYRAHPGACSAIEDERGGSLTYDGLRALTGETQSLLAALGIGPHDTIAFVLDNGPHTAAMFIALLGYCRVAPISPKLKAAEIAFALGDLNVAAVITTPDFPEAVAAAKQCAAACICCAAPARRATGWKPPR